MFAYNSFAILFSSFPTRVSQGLQIVLLRSPAEAPCTQVGISNLWGSDTFSGGWKSLSEIAIPFDSDTHPSQLLHSSLRSWPDLHPTAPVLSALQL